MTEWRRNETEGTLELIIAEEALGAVRRVDGSTDIEVFLFDGESTNHKLFFGNGLDDKDMKDLLVEKVVEMLEKRRDHIDKLIEELQGRCAE